MKKFLLSAGALILYLLSVNLFADNPDFGYISSITIPFYGGSGWEDYRDSLIEQDSSIASVENNPLIGVSLGLVSEYPLNHDFSLRSAFIFSASGGGYVAEFENKTRSSHLISEYNLDLPLLLKWKCLRHPPGIMYLIGGPQISFLLFQQEFEQEEAVFHNSSLDRDLFEPVGFGYTAGLGVDVPDENYTIYLELMFLREISSTLSAFEKIYQTAVSFNTGIRWKRRNQ